MRKISFSDWQKNKEECNLCDKQVCECEYCVQELDTREIEVICPECGAAMVFNDEYNPSKTDDYTCICCGFNRK